jgi:hypothetical protein
MTVSGMGGASLSGTADIDLLLSHRTCAMLLWETQ